MSAWLRLLLGLALPGCFSCSSNPPVNIGETFSGAQLSAYAGSWDGTVDNFTFPAGGSNRLRLTLDGNGQGSLQVGSAPPLPAPTDPDSGYPADDDGTGAFYIGYLHDGFAYTVRGASAGSAGLNVTVSSLDLFGAWCALETPIPTYATYFLRDGGGLTTEPGAIDGGIVTATYSCVQNWPSYTIPPSTCFQVDPSGETHTLNCGKMGLCQEACTCNATGCTAAYLPTSSFMAPVIAKLDPTGTTLGGTITVNGPNDFYGPVTFLLQKAWN